MVVERVRVEVAVPPDVRVTLDELKLAVGPLVTDGKTAAARLTVPANPLTDISVTV